MSDKKPVVLYTAAYDSVSAALTNWDAVEQLHKDAMIGRYDAAVIDKEDGKPHIVKRMDRPGVRVIPEWFGGGTLPRKELHEAAQELTACQAGPRGRRADDRGSGRQGAGGCSQGREAHRGCHDRRNRERAARSAQELATDAAA